METNERHHCLECGKTVYGRPDKKFCSDECKNSWHNEEKRHDRATRRRAIAAIDRNYDILRQLLSYGATGAPLEDLTRLGFNPEAVTAVKTKTNGHPAYCCYDVQYRMSVNKISGLKWSGEK